MEPPSLNTLQSSDKRLRPSNSYKQSSPARIKGQAKTLYISSAARDKYQYESPCDFSIQTSFRPDRKGDQLTSVGLDSLSFPCAVYTINATNDTVYIAENGLFDLGMYPTVFTLRIPHGMYSPFELCNTLNSLSNCWTPILHTNGTDVGIPPLPAYEGWFWPVCLTNSYSWRYDNTTMKFILIATPGSVSLFSTPSILCSCNRQKQTGSTTMFGCVGDSSTSRTSRAFYTDVYITSAMLVSNDVLRIETYGTKHNLCFNTLITEIILKSANATSNDDNITTPSRTIRFVNRMFFSPLFTSTGNCNTYGDEWLTIEIPGASNMFTSAFPNAATGEVIVDGVLRVLCAQRSAWETLGFTRSTDIGYTPLNIIGIAPAPSYPPSTSHLFATDMPVFAPTGTGVTFPVSTTNPLWNITINASISANTVAMSAPASGNIIFISKTALTFNANSSFLPLPSGQQRYVYIQGYFVGDKVADLRGTSQHVFMRLAINNFFIGKHVRVTGSGGLVMDLNNADPCTRLTSNDADSVFAHWDVDMARGTTVLRFGDMHNMGSFDNIKFDGFEILAASDSTAVVPIPLNVYNRVDAAAKTKNLTDKAHATGKATAGQLGQVAKQGDASIDILASSTMSPEGLTTNTTPANVNSTVADARRLNSVLSATIMNPSTPIPTSDATTITTTTATTGAKSTASAPAPAPAPNAAESVAPTALARPKSAAKRPNLTEGPLTPAARPCEDAQDAIHTITVQLFDDRGVIVPLYTDWHFTLRLMFE